MAQLLPLIQREPKELGVTPAIRDLLLRIECEYREMPGLNLTVSQAQRLWGLDNSTCSLALTTLVERGVLKQSAAGTFLRGSSG